MDFTFGGEGWQFTFDQGEVVDRLMAPVKFPPAGKYSVTASYSYATDPGVRTEFWQGQVTTGGVEIEIKPKGAANLEKRALAVPDKAAAKALALEYVKAKGLNWGAVWIVSELEGKYWMVTFEKELPKPGPDGAAAYPLLQIEKASGMIIE